MGTQRLGIVIDVDYQGGNEVKTAADDLKRVGKAGDDAAPGLQKSSTATDGLMSKFKTLASAGAIAVVGKQLLDFGKKAIMAASDVEEMQSKFNTVFKHLSGDVTAELQEFANAANRSVYDLQGFAATLQDTFVPLGFARDEAAQTSIQLVKLAEDLASFNNLNTADVVNDLQSAMVGNTETLRKYGVVATQAAIDQKALEMGLEFTKGQMDAQTKAAAILAITLESTTDAQGDAIRTADSFANSLKGLEASTSRLSVAIGQQLIPSAKEGVGVIGALAGGLADYTMAENALIKAQESGLLTGREAVELRNQMFFTSMNAADVMAILAEKEAQLGVEVSATTTQMETQEMQMQRLADAAETLTVITDEEREAMIAAGEAAQGDFSALEDLTGAQIEATVQRNIAIQAAEAQAEADKIAAEAAAELAEKQRELAAATGDYFSAAIEAEDAIRTFNETTGETVTNQESLNQAIYDAADASGASATQLAVLGGALGLYSDEAVEAALQTALIQAKIDELAQAYVAGTIGVDEMRTSLNTFIAGLSTTETAMAGAASTADTLSTAILGIPAEHVTVFRSDLSGFVLPPTAAAEAATPTTAGPGMGGPIMDTGGIIPGAFMQPIAMTGHGGEMVLNPQQQANLFDLLNGRGKGGIGGGVSIAVYVNGADAGNVGNLAARGVMDAVRRLGVPLNA